MAEVLKSAEPQTPSTSPEGDNQPTSMHAAMGSGQAKTPPAAAEPAYLPVTHYPPNALGIRGLNSAMGVWARAGDGRFVVVERGGKVQDREAWQGLDWVGFRTAQSYPGKSPRP
jgi:hypothetical protein